MPGRCPFRSFSSSDLLARGRLPCTLLGNAVLAANPRPFHSHLQHPAVVVNHVVSAMVSMGLILDPVMGKMQQRDQVEGVPS